MTTEEYIKSINADLDKLNLPSPINRAKLVGFISRGFEEGAGNSSNSKPAQVESPKPIQPPVSNAIPPVVNKPLGN